METETITIINELNLNNEYTTVVCKWLEYKKSRGEKYKTTMSLKSLIKQLVKFSDSNPITADLIVEQSIANNWAGLFELKQNNTNNKAPVIRPDYSPTFQPI